MDRHVDPNSRPEEFLARKEPSKGLLLFLEDIARDLRLSCRNLARNPGFTIVVIVNLALGVGVNTGVFTLVDTLLFRPLPVPNPHQIVSIGSITRGQPDSNNLRFSFPVYLTIQKANQVFSGLIAYTGLTVHLNADGFTERLWGGLVSANYTDALGIEPSIGRGFRPEEGQVPGRYPVVMISDRLWRDRFHGSRDIVGKTVRVNGHPFTLVGVMPRHFTGKSSSSVNRWPNNSGPPPILLENGSFPDQKAGRWSESLKRSGIASSAATKIHMCTFRCYSSIRGISL